ncbi:flocculation protein FLO11-like isoform X2 [Pimephales promelas]|uniref:flocculation protein FLO11-like isoform X2 n=1 Tax=Pimephales promelas TaxID=90988 RepID=UPI001955EB44|nr:flocculation protein FLO11-like isoform X2 [Pimephales promelas]
MCSGGAYSSTDGGKRWSHSTTSSSAQPLTSSHCWHGDQTVISSRHFEEFQRGERSIPEGTTAQTKKSQCIRKRQRDEFLTSEVTMEMTLLSITVWFTHFLIASALYFNTLPTNTITDSTETTQVMQATKSRQEPKILIHTTPFSPLTTKAQESTTNLPSEVHTQPNTTPNVASTQETTSLHQYNSSTPSQGMMDDGIGISNASSVAMSHTNTSHTTVSTNFARVTPQNNETVTMSSASYTDDGRTVQTVDTLSDLLSSVSTVPWKDRTEKEGDRTKADEGNYETNSTQATFANTNESRGTLSTEGSYSITSEHREEPYNTTADTIGESTATARNDWSTSQSTDIPMITPASSTARDPTVTDGPEYHTSIGGVNHSMTQQHINSFTNSTAHAGRENITGTDTPGDTTTYNNNSIITGVLTDATNKTDTESKAWHKCLNPNPKSRQFTLMCFITLWTLAMIATIFLGITIFLWVRLSVSKKKRKQREKGGQTCEKESLWADPKASVQERVEFWYVNGSTMEADRKQKDRKRQERMKRRGQEQDRKENGLWIQPKVTVDDITEFWYANRRMKEERVPDTDT